jgi:hypothetical protein
MVFSDGIFVPNISSTDIICVKIVLDINYLHRFITYIKSKDM